MEAVVATIIPTSPPSIAVFQLILSFPSKGPGSPGLDRPAREGQLGLSNIVVSQIACGSVEGPSLPPEVGMKLPWGL